VNSKDRILAALNLKTPDKIPTFEWFIDTQVAEILTGHRDPIDIVEALDIDGINIRPDYDSRQVDAESFADEWGAVRKHTGDSIPAIVKNPIQDMQQLDDYVFPDVDASARFDLMARAQARFGDTRAIILNLRDGFSDMRDILGYENALMELVAAPDRFRKLLNRAVDYNLALARRAKREFGIEIVATTDDIATDFGLLMRPETYFEVIGPAFQRVMQGYKDLGLHIIKHCDGNCSDVIDFWIDSGIDCLDPIRACLGLTSDLETCRSSLIFGVWEIFPSVPWLAVKWFAGKADNRYRQSILLSLYRLSASTGRIVCDDMTRIG